MLILRLSTVPLLFLVGVTFECFYEGETALGLIGVGACWFALIVTLWKPWRGVA